MNIEYRHESPEDFKVIKSLYNNTFKSSEQGDLIDALRLTTTFTTELSIIAEIKGKIIGHILLYPVRINSGIIKFASLSLAAIAITPLHQDKGIGTALIDYAIEKAQSKDYTSIIAIKYPNYFSRFGFESASKKDLKLDFEIADEQFTVREIKENGGMAGIQGTVVFPKEFDAIKA